MISKSSNLAQFHYKSNESNPDHFHAQSSYAPMWQRPLLAHPGPRRLAIHWAALSSRICLSILPVTSLLCAACLASGEITPTREIKHCACALTIQLLKSRLYCPVMVPSCPSSSGRPVERQRCATLLSAQVTIN